MIPRFIADGHSAPAGSLAVDGPVPGAAMVYSHWQGAPDTPVELLADTSTGMLLRAAADPQRWLAPYPVGVIGHLDADGLLALATACRPEVARRHGSLIEDAAAGGDFQTWRGEPAYRLMLALHRRIHAGPTPQAVVDGVVADLDALVDQALSAGDIDEGVGAARAGIAAIYQGRVAIARHPGLAVITWDRDLGHDWDPFQATGGPDDLPLHVLGGFIADDLCQLRIERSAAGATVALDAPRHSWARTVIRPTIPWPEVGPLAARLQAGETGGCRWVVRPEAAKRGFTCLLATMGQPSRQDPQAIAETVIAELARG